MTGDNKLSIIIPTFNERDNIVPLVERIHQALGGNYNILFVDDNSRDGTAEQISALAGKYPLRLMVRRDKRGLASAVVDGLETVPNGVVAVMDADLQHPPEIIPALVGAVSNGADMAIASRYVKGGGCKGWTLTRRIISKVAVALAHVLLPATRQVKDPMSGYFMFRRQSVDRAVLQPSGYKILLEILVKGDFRTVSEVPYTFETRSRGESKLKMRTQVDYLKHILSLMRATGELARFIKFGLVGLSGVGVNEGMLWLLNFRVGLPLAFSSAIAVEVSILTNFTLNNFYTFADRGLPGLKSAFGRLGKFNLISLAGLGLNVGTLLLLNHLFGIPPLIANLFGIALASLWNYAWNQWWTWK